MKLRLVHAAASNTAGGTIKVASCGNTTYEGCKIDTIFGQEKVNVISVDSMAAAGMSLSSGKDRNVSSNGYYSILWVSYFLLSGALDSSALHPLYC